MSNICAVGINFADNDFYFTIRSFLESVQKHYLNDEHIWSEDKEKNRQHIVRLFNDTIYSHYIMFQNKYQYDNGNSEHLRDKYMKISEKNVFIGEDEIRKYQADNNGWANSEFHYFIDPYLDVETI